MILRHGNIRKLEDISHDLIDAKLPALIQSQRQLETLTFSPPPQVWVSEGDRPRGPRLGDARPHGLGVDFFPFAELPFNDSIGYPPIGDLLVALQDKPKFQHLRIPACMYEISQSAIIQLSKLTNLTHLEIGFDYHDPVCNSRILLRQSLKCLTA